MTSYTNIHGETINLSSLQTPKRPKVSKPSQSHHKGFRAMGFSPEQVADARTKHEQDVRLAKDFGREPPGPFDLDSWMRRAKPVRIGKPFATRDAAQAACDLAAKQGWLKTITQELSKGGAT